ncbi:MAG: addiction module protein [Fibrobacterota bacterium]
MSLAEIKEMSTIERIHTMEMLWDALILDETDLKSPSWHEDILKKRKLQFESGESKVTPLSRLKGLLRK